MPLLTAHSPIRTLTIVFVAWKVLLLAVAAGSQVVGGPTYDTSSSLLLLTDDDHGSYVAASGSNLIARLVSWDAIYFVKAAGRGYLFEQEWAFGAALPTCISVVIRVLKTLHLLPATTTPTTPYLAALTGILLTNLSHYASTLLLHRLTLSIWGPTTQQSWALASALLHILSPAGLFLSAPYAESPCALLSFAGWLCLVHSCSSSRRDLLTLLAGLSFGAATAFRTNAVLNGAPFAAEACSVVYHLVEDLEPGRTAGYVRRLGVLGVSGLLVAAGTLGPQYSAYRTYCVAADGGEETGVAVRPWCGSLVPSIYNFVQKEYWNSGFLHYWTPGNIPLFALAAPMLFIMSKGGLDIFFQTAKLSPSSPPSAASSPQNVIAAKRLRLVVRAMVFAQILLVLLAFTNYHVQIITRLSSGYPAWYWWVAACVRSPKTRGFGSALVVYMVMYALIQTVLFASFLPPA